MEGPTCGGGVRCGAQVSNPRNSYVEINFLYWQNFCPIFWDKKNAMHFWPMTEQKATASHAQASPSRRFATNVMVHMFRRCL